MRPAVPARDMSSYLVAPCVRLLMIRVAKGVLEFILDVHMDGMNMLERTSVGRA